MEHRWDPTDPLYLMDLITHPKSTSLSHGLHKEIDQVYQEMNNVSRSVMIQMVFKSLPRSSQRMTLSEQAKSMFNFFLGGFFPHRMQH